MSFRDRGTDWRRGRSRAALCVINDSTIQLGAETYLGYWLKNGNRSSGIWAGSEKLVTHEKMHALLQSTLHSASYLNGPCRDLTYANEQ